MVAGLLAPLPDGAAVQYVKHMTHHLFDDDDLAWTVGAFRNVLLIRTPDEVVASYLRSRDACEPADIGLLQQVRLLDTLEDAGERHRSSTRPTSCTTLGATCAGCATGSASTSPTGCSPGPPAPATATESGHRTGTTLSGPRPASSRTAPREVRLDADGEAVADACRPAYERLHSQRSCSARLRR